MVSEKTYLAYFGHHKCASSWISKLLMHVCMETGHKYTHIHTIDSIKGDLTDFLADQNADVFTFGNADYAYARCLKPIKAFHVIRDPRDILISAYFSHLNSHPTGEWPELVEYRQRLKSITKEKGLMLELDFSQHVFEHISNWDYHRNDIMELKMEELIQDPYSKFLQIFEFLELLDCREYTIKRRMGYWTSSRINRHSNKLGISKYSPVLPIKRKIPAHVLLGIAYDRRFSKISGGRKEGSEDTKSHYRKGQTGDWKNHFYPELKDIFKKRYSSLLIELGYEKDENW